MNFDFAVANFNIAQEELQAAQLRADFAAAKEAASRVTFYLREMYQATIRDRQCEYIALDSPEAINEAIIDAEFDILCSQVVGHEENEILNALRRQN